MSNIPMEAFFANDYLHLDKQYAETIISVQKTLDLAKNLLEQAWDCSQCNDETPSKFTKFSNELTFLAQELGNETRVNINIIQLLKSIRYSLDQFQYQPSLCSNKLSFTIEN